jgi:hypothetical protein
LQTITKCKHLTIFKKKYEYFSKKLGIGDYKVEKYMGFLGEKIYDLCF